MMKTQDIKLGEGHDMAEIQKMVDAHTAEGLYEQGKLIGCVKQAHDTDENLSAHTMLENLATTQVICLRMIMTTLACVFELPAVVLQRGSSLQSF